VATTSWAPVYDQSDGHPRVVAAEVVTDTLTGWFQQPYLPVAVTPLASWLMADAGYVQPPGPVVEYPPTSGQGWPR